MSDEEERVPRARRPDDDENDGEGSEESGEDLMNADGDMRGSRAGTDDSSEEEEDDPEEARRVAEGFIVDGDEDEDEDDDGSGSDSEGTRKKKKKDKQRKRRKRRAEEKDDDADDLDEEDLDLVAENLGVRRDKDKHRLKRFRRGSATPPPQSNRRDLSRIFEDDSDDEELPSLADAVRGGLTGGKRVPMRGDYADDDDLDDFIDDDDDDDDGSEIDEEEREQRRSDRKEQRRRQRAAGKALGMDPSKVGFSRESWEVLHEVFGRGDDYNWALEDISEEEAEEDGALGGKKKLTYKQIFEPAQIAAKLLTERDEIIKQVDHPERMQLLLPSDASIELLNYKLTDSEVEQAAVWVQSKLSQRCTMQFVHEEGAERAYYDEWLACVTAMVRAIINEGLEPPYLFQHRLDDLELRTGEFDPSTNGYRIVRLLQLRELFTLAEQVHKFKILLHRRRELRPLFVKIHAAHQGITDPEEQEDLSRTEMGASFESALSEMRSLEELSDLTEYVSMTQGAKLRELQADEDHINGLADEVNDSLRIALKQGGSYKRSGRQGQYEKLKKSAASDFTAHFGLTVDEVAENVAAGTNNRVHYPEPAVEDPMDAAETYAGKDTEVHSTAEVMAAAKTILAIELGRHPLVRRAVRDFFRKHATMSVHPTERGESKIDDQHAYFNFKYLRPKGVNDIVLPPPPQYSQAEIASFAQNRQRTPTLPLPSQVQYLMALQAEAESLVKTTVGLLPELQEELKNMISDAWLSNEVSDVSQRWNAIRRDIVDKAMHDVLLPMGNVWIREWLREECRDWVARQAAAALTLRINTAPYKSRSMEARAARDDIEEEEDSDPAVPKVLAVTQGEGDPRREPVRAVLLDSKGRLRRTALFAHLRPPQEDENGMDDRQRRRGPEPDPRADFLALIKEYQPDVIVVGGFNPGMLELRAQIRTIVDQAEQELIEQFGATEEDAALSRIDVISTYDDVARLYRHSRRAAEEVSELNITARYCLALARYVQSPVQEFAALGDDISAVQIYEHQRLIPKETLLRQLKNSLVTIVNDVGVDINVALHDSYYQHMLQFVAGLGPRKASALVRAVTTQLEGRASNRLTLLEEGILGPVVFANAASFLRVRADEMADDADEEDDARKATDVLDSTRIHPDDYRYARKIAADAIGKDEEDLEGMHPSFPCAELMDMPDRAAKLSVLDLDSYAQMLEDKHNMRKRAVLLQCSRELESPYEELRAPFVLPNSNDFLTMLTGETRKTIDLQLIVPVTIFRMVERAEPYPYLAVRLECGLEGSIHAPYAILGWNAALYPPSRDHGPARNPLLKERYRIGQSLNALIIDIKEEELKIELSADVTHMAEGDNIHRATPVDARFFDLDKHEAAQRLRKEKSSKQAGRVYRTIKHPNFHNVNAGKAEEMLANEPNGSVIIRPSSKGKDHLALTWRVYEKVFKHFDIAEGDKETDYSLGRILRVNDVPYSDLDEVIVGLIEPMARKMQELENHDKYKGEEAELNAYLTNFCLGNPTKSQYGFAIDRKHPGYFKLSFKSSKDGPIQSWPVKVVPQGYVLVEDQRGSSSKQPLPDVLALCNEFKARYLIVGAARRQQQAGNHRVDAPHQAHGAGGSRTPFGTLKTPLGRSTPNAYGPTPLHAGTRTPNPYGSQQPGPPPQMPMPPGPPPQHPGAPPVRPPMAAPPTRGPMIHPSRLGHTGGYPGYR